jgi:hypothetical protein
MDPSLELKKVFRAMVIMDGVLIAGLFLYALIVELIKSQLKPFSGLISMRHGQSLRYIFYGVAVAVVVLIRILSRIQTRATQAGETLPQFIHRLSRGTVMVSTVAELPAVLGFGLFLLTGFSRDFYFLLFVSLFLEFMYFPRIKAWQDQIRERFPQSGI